MRSELKYLRVGDLTFCDVAKGELPFLPDENRTLRPGNLAKMYPWQDHKSGVLTVWRKGRKNLVLDGTHRGHGCIDQCGPDHELKVEVFYDLTDSQAHDVWSSRNYYRQGASGPEQFVKAVGSKSPDHVKTMDTLKANGISLGRGVNKTNAPLTALAILRQDGSIPLSRTLQVIKQAWTPDFDSMYSKLWGATMLRGVAGAIRAYPEVEVEAWAKALSKESPRVIEEAGQGKRDTHAAGMVTNRIIESYNKSHKGKNRLGYIHEAA